MAKEQDEYVGYNSIGEMVEQIEYSVIRTRNNSRTVQWYREWFDVFKWTAPRDIWHVNVPNPLLLIYDAGRGLHYEGEYL